MVVIRRSVVLALALAVVWVANPAASEDAAAKKSVPVLSELVGKYDYAGARQKDEAAIAAQIESVVSEMGRMSRGIAREKLTKANKVPQKLTISTKGDEVTLSLDAWTVTAPLDGSKRAVTTPLGDKGKVSFHVNTMTLHEEVETRQATRTNTFRFTKDGKLSMKVKEASSKLPKPVEYELLYKRLK